MKFILILSLLSLAGTSFSGETPSKADVVEGIKASLENKDLDCTDSNGQTQGKASALDFSTLLNMDFTMTISDSSQPAITFNLDYKEDGADREGAMVIKTNSDQNSVTEIEITDSKLVTKRQNIGTILKPVFENVTVKEISQKLICK